MSNRINELESGQIIKFSKPKCFEFVKALNSGGTGKTILMRDTTINEMFVCKKYDPEQKEYEDAFFNRFVDEIKIMYSVYNNNIVRVYDYFLYPEYKTGYIIMEYIQGEDIEEYFQSGAPENINSVFVQIINAFAYLEKKRILHRDIRAANVIVNASGIVKVIDFGFGKRLNVNMSNDQASIILNWPASKLPQEILNEVYNEQTEIFYVGYLIKNIIKKYNIECFKYSVLLEKMTQINPEERIKSFELIQNSIAEQTFEQIQFTYNQKEIYQNFAYALCSSLSYVEDNLEVERNVSIIIEELRIILRENSLEKYITQPQKLLSVFVKSNFGYNDKTILVEDVKKFYNFLVSQTNAIKDIILDNLYGRIGKISVVDSTFISEGLPFD